MPAPLADLSATPTCSKSSVSFAPPARNLVPTSRREKSPSTQSRVLEFFVGLLARETKQHQGAHLHVAQGTMPTVSTAAVTHRGRAGSWPVLCALLVLFFSTTTSLVDAASGTPPSYALLTTNAGCWLPDSTNEVMYAADAADAPFEFAKAFCEARGGALANAAAASTTAATWSGVV